MTAAFKKIGGRSLQEKNKKPKWDKPKLIVLVKGRPEEVLLDCKQSLADSTYIYNACQSSQHGCPEACWAITQQGQ